ALINAAFNHEGATILAYLPGGNPLTLESIVYGLCAAAMILSVICWFSCYNEVMTSDKFIYLFGRVSPALSLIFSMTLRFVPRFTEKLREVTIARRSLGKGAGNRNVRERIKSGLSSLSATLTWALENSIETADSMKARGYGISGRTSFSIYTFERKDKIALALIFALSLCVICGRICGSLSFSYFPTFGAARSDFAAVSSVFGYFLLCVMPIIIELKGVRRWKKSE
ncbi:MAG: energy-coupling factor transporter transmembrane protein EcfT, partial [Oscillospiraceae bacterium]|nr:energy-coupling factor transporter transmembrane protein EcfT [Oscillospiraceae bacterium]